MFWFAIQTYTGCPSILLRWMMLIEPATSILSTGSECVYQMLKAIWPSVARIPNKLNGNITTTGMMCYFLFWLLQLPFLFISPHRASMALHAKALIVPPAFLAMMIWAFATTGGGEIFHQPGNTQRCSSRMGVAWCPQ
jgi:NCS1 family nucleobase:cation symporter-1